MRCLIVPALSLACFAYPASAGEVNQRTTYFSVHGSTLAELSRDLDRRGPRVSRFGSRHPGATEVTFDGKVDYVSAKNACRVGRPNVSLRLVINVPRWHAPKSASRETVAIWRIFEADIVKHENHHAAIARQWLGKLERALRKLPPERNCAAMKREVEATSRRILAEHERAQNAFDAREAKEIPRRLDRAVRRTMGKLAAR